MVSGGARGADQLAMRETLASGGKSIGVLPCDLLKACLEKENRDALASGATLLFSAQDPELRPFRFGAVAMDRNKYIYAMADGCFVAQSGITTSTGQSGTFEGAKEELKRPQHRPVCVFLGNPPSKGCLELLKRGAKPWKFDMSVAENFAETTAQPSTAIDTGLLPGFS